MENQFDLCSLDMTPFKLREQRKEFRNLIKEYKKTNEIDKLKTVLNQYYNMAVVVTICYGDVDCKTGVSGYEADIAEDTVKKICKKINFSYDSDGILENSSFISNNDWNTYVKTFGESNHTFDFGIVQKEALQLMNEKLDVIRNIFEKPMPKSCLENYAGNHDIFFREEKLPLLLAAEEEILSVGDGKSKFIDAAIILETAFHIAVPLINYDIIGEVSFFLDIMSRLIVFDTAETNRSVTAHLDVINRSVGFSQETKKVMELFVPENGEVDEGKLFKHVKELFDAKGVETPDVSIYCNKFLAEIGKVEFKNIVLEALIKLLRDEIKSRSAGKSEQSMLFMEKLENSLELYRVENSSISEAIASLIQLSREIQKTDKKSLGKKSFSKKKTELSLVIDEEVGSNKWIVDKTTGKNLSHDECMLNVLKNLENYMDMLIIHGDFFNFKPYLKSKGLYDNCRLLNVDTFDRRNNEWEDDDIIIFHRLEYTNSHIGTANLRSDLEKLLKIATVRPEKLFLLLLGIPESELLALVMEHLPGENAILPGNVFLNWDDFLKILDVFRSSDGSEQFAAYQDMPLMLRDRLLRSGAGMIPGCFRFIRWDEYLSDKLDNGSDLHDQDFLRAIALSGGNSIDFLKKHFPKVELFNDLLNHCRSQNLPNFSLDVLTDIGAGLINIVIHLDHLNPCRLQVAEIIRFLARKSDKQNLLVECYESFKNKGCREYYDFLTEEIGTGVENKDDLSAVCAIIKRCHFMDPSWIVIASSLDDEYMLSSLIMEKLSAWLEPVKAPKKLIATISDYLEKGDREYLQEVKKLSLKTGFSIFSHFYELRCLDRDNYRWNFRKVFLDFFKKNKHPDFYHRLEKLDIELNIAGTIQSMTGSDINEDLDGKFVEKIQNHVSSDNILFGLRDVIKYLLYQAENGDCNISAVAKQIIEKNGMEGVESLYNILKIDPNAFKEGGLDVLMENINVFPPSNEILTNFRADKRKKIRDLAIVLEAGCKIDNVGNFLALYLKERNKNEFLSTAVEILNGSGKEEAGYTAKTFLGLAEKFTDLSKCKREPVTILPIDFDKIPKLKWQENNAEVQEFVQIFMINSFFTVTDLKFLNFYYETDEEIDELKIDLSKNPQFQFMIDSVSLFNQKSFKRFIEAMAKMLVNLAKNKKIDTKYVKRALPVFGFLGTDDCFCSFDSGKIVKQRRGSYYDAYYYSLLMKGSSYTKLLGITFRLDNIKDKRKYISISLLQEISDIRKIFTDETMLKDDNCLARKKVKTAQLNARVWKSVEKIMSKFYLDFIHDSLAVYRKMSYDNLKYLFVDDICGLQIGRATVWGLYENGVLGQTFTLSEQGKFYDVMDNEVEFTSFSGKTIDVVHPAELSAGDISAWKDYFDRKGLVSSVEQLDIPVFRKADNALNGYLNNDEILPESFWKRKMGSWEREDEHGYISSFYRTIALQNGFYCVKIETEISLRGWFVTDPVLKRIGFYFCDSDTSNFIELIELFYKDCKFELSLNDVSERLYSEICRDIEKYFLREEFLSNNDIIGDKGTPKELKPEYGEEITSVITEPIENIEKDVRHQSDDDSADSGCTGLTEIIQDKDVVLLENNIDKYLKNELEVADKLIALEIEPYNPITLAKNHLACSHLDDEQFVHSLMQIENKKLCSNGNLFSLVFESLLVNGSRDAETKLDSLFDEIIGIYGSNSNSSFTATEKRSFWGFLAISMDNMVDIDHPDIIKYIDKVREHVDDENREFLDDLLDDARNKSVAKLESEEESKVQQDETARIMNLLLPKIEEIENAVNEMEQEGVDINKVLDLREKVNSLMSDIDTIDDSYEIKETLKSTIKSLSLIIDSREKDLKNEPGKKPVKVQQDETVTMMDVFPKIEEIQKLVDSVTSDIEQERVDINDVLDLRKK
ncbi:MAG: DUF3387 domain-containing protein, partial [Clostridiales bacterium]|nr:DUF3387 domain-containing protein [Clostridiales bacterium]